MTIRIAMRLCLTLAIETMMLPIMSITADAQTSQGWSVRDRTIWYETSQGSRLLQASWMQALELADSEEKFLSAAHMRKLGYLPGASPRSLPLGFVVDQSPEDGFDTPMLGMNCAACHTREITSGTRAIRIDGAPALADFEGFMRAILKSLIATRNDEAKFARFSENVLGEATAGRQVQLKDALDKQIEWYARLAKKNDSAVPYGHGRLDAQGHILNKISLVVGAAEQLQDYPANAPVSYPHIWNAAQHDKVQWNGVAENSRRPIVIRGQKTDLGALGRNVGEVLGVFGEIDVDDRDLRVGYKSSVRVFNLIELERVLSKLHSPRWPAAIFGVINESQGRAGKAIFENRALRDASWEGGPQKTCAECHKPLAWNDTQTPIEAQMQPISETGTDIWTACNTFMHKSRAGHMTGRLERIVTGARIGDPDLTVRLLTNAIANSITFKADEIAERLGTDLLVGRREMMGMESVGPPTALSVEGRDERERTCRTQKHDLLRYKARPLNGIWATAPFLHNGSVMTLYDLLLPSKERPGVALGTTMAGGAPRLRRDTFIVGSSAFEPKEVGLRSEAAPGRVEFRVRTPDGKDIPGNSNAGHEWGAQELSDDERWALVAYLKSL